MSRNALGRIVIISACVVGIAGYAASSAAKGKQKPPNKKIVLKACGKKKPAPVFDHPAHVKMMKETKQDCDVCHHKVKNKEPEKNKCTECHTKKQGDELGTCSDKSKKKNPFHVQCIGCHKKMKKTSEKVPVKCKGCHKK